jgi:hypothetical protein
MPPSYPGDREGEAVHRETSAFAGKEARFLEPVNPGRKKARLDVTKTGAAATYLFDGLPKAESLPLRSTPDEPRPRHPA